MDIMQELTKIAEFVLNASVHILPFFGVSVLIAAGINQFKFTQHLVNFLKRNVIYAIVISTLIGALSPLCACGVIPTLFALINVGIPLAPIM